MPTISPLKRLSSSRSQVTVSVSPEEKTKAETVALERLAQGVNIEGFRPGKAPPDMVRLKVDPDMLLEETVRSFLPDAIQSVAKENNLSLIMPPRVEVSSREPLTLTLTFVERPEVKMKSIDTSKLKKTAPKFDEKDIERMVSYLLEQYRVTTPHEGPADEGHQVTMDFVGKSDDGAEIAGTRSTNYQAVLGSKTLIPGFEDGLKGAKKGEKRDLKLTFPAKYHAEHLQGKPVTFTVDVRNVEKVSTPTLTPEFVKEKALGESPEDVRKRISDSMKEEEERMDRQRREQALFDEIRKSAQFEIAPELLEQEIQGLLEDISRQLEEQKQTFEDWLKRRKKTPEDLQQELREEAEKRIKLRFGVQKLMEDKKIEASPADVKELAAQTLASVPAEQRDAAEKFYAEGGEGYDQLVWQKKVEKLVSQFLA